SGWSSDGTDWIWYGPGGTGSPTEDWKFGAYMGGTGTGLSPQELDDTSHNKPNMLLVVSAGDDRNEGPGHPVTYYLSTDPFKQFRKTRTREWIDGDEAGYDTLNPLACAKNVLTVGGVYDVPGGYVNEASVLSAEISSMGPTDDGRIKPDVVAQALRTGTG